MSIQLTFLLVYFAAMVVIGVWVMRRSGAGPED